MVAYICDTILKTLLVYVYTFQHLDAFLLLENIIKGNIF